MTQRSDKKTMPWAVEEAVRKFAERNGLKYVEVLETVEYDNVMGCWFFWHNEVYHGIEVDGYLHT